MDLRDKPGVVQKFLERMVQFRLIFLFFLVLFSVMFVATGWQAMSSLPLGASESLGMWMADMGGEALGGAKYLGVAAVAAFVLFFVFGGVKSGVGSLVAVAAFVGSLVLLDGSEGMQLVFYGVFAAVSLVLLFVAKIGLSNALFPFALSWLLLTGFLAWCPVAPDNAWLSWAALSALGFAGVVAFALNAGKELGEGTPATGAIVKAGKRMVLPVTIGGLLAVVATSVDMAQVTGRQVAGAAVLWLAFVVWFFGFTFGTMAFAPWDRLRSGSRRVQMKDKKKKKA